MSFACAYRGVTPRFHFFQVPQTPSSNSPRVQSWTRGTDTWAAGTNGTKTINRSLNVAGVGGWIYTFGGSENSGWTISTTSTIYKADAGTWAANGTHTVRDGSVCPVLGVSVLLVGGTTDADLSSSTSDRGSTTVDETYLGVALVSRTAITGKRTEAGWGQHVSTGDLAASRALIAGGFERTSGAESFLATAFGYLHITDTWSAETSLASARFAGGCFTIDNETYLVGGSDDGLTDADNISTVLSYEMVTRNTWTSRTDLPGTARRSIATGVIEGKGYAVGGSSDGDGTVNYSFNYEYDPFRDTWTAKENYSTPASLSLRGAGA